MRRYAFSLSLSLSAFVPLCPSLFSPSPSLDTSFFFTHPWPSCPYLSFFYLSTSVASNRCSPLSLFLLPLSLSSSLSFFLRVYHMHVYHTGPRVKVHRPNKPRTDRLALQPPPTPVFPSHCSPVDSLRSSSRYNAHRVSFSLSLPLFLYFCSTMLSSSHLSAGCLRRSHVG